MENKKLEEVPFGGEAIVAAIVEIDKAMKALNRSRLSRKAITALIKDSSGIPKTTIDVVLNNLEALEKIYLKPKNHGK